MAQIKAKKIMDSISGNKKSRYMIDELIKAGLPHNKAVAMAAYHGSLGSIKKIKDTKSLLKYKYLKDTLSEKEARGVIDYFSGKKRVAKKVVSTLDSTRELRGVKAKKMDSVSISDAIEYDYEVEDEKVVKKYNYKGFNVKIAEINGGAKYGMLYYGTSDTGEPYLDEPNAHKTPKNAQAEIEKYLDEYVAE